MPPSETPAVPSTASDTPSSDAEPGSPTEAEPPQPEPGLTLSLTTSKDNPHALPPADRDWITDRLHDALHQLRVTHATLAIHAIRDDEMAQLHQQFSGVPGTTDALTFDLRPTPEGPPHGDIAIGLDVAARRAAQLPHDTKHELLLYALHGVMHLLGEDDTTPDAAQRMHQREDDTLTAIGVGPLYHTPHGTPAESPA
ncbi:MAG: rRNA maturation RNase YbeY [Planctomycetota bacterium]